MATDPLCYAGHESEAAFSRAIKRSTGMPPVAGAALPAAESQAA